MNNQARRARWDYLITASLSLAEDKLPTKRSLYSLWIDGFRAVTLDKADNAVEPLLSVQQATADHAGNSRYRTRISDSL